MKRPDPREPRLPESVTRHLAEPKQAIWPTPDDRHRSRTGRQRPRIPSRAFAGVWVWVALYNLVGAAILAALWASMGL